LRRAARRDENEHALVSIARALGAQWVQAGPLDGWVCWRGRWMPVEIKRPEREGRKGEYTEEQLRFFQRCRERGSPWLVWRTERDVYDALGARRTA